MWREICINKSHVESFLGGFGVSDKGLNIFTHT